MPASPRYSDYDTPAAGSGVQQEAPQSFDSASSSPGKNAPLSVSEALKVAKAALEDIQLRVVGEVSEVKAKPSYKAVYFTIKDRSSSLSCLMWNSLYHKANLNLEVGQLVELTGHFSLYAARGTMNFDVRHLELAGEGRLRMEVAQRAQKLQAEGLMDPQRKRPLPSYPGVVGLVTSPHGDAVHDMLRTLRRRWPFARVLVAGVQVEGALAAQGLIEGLECVARAGAQVIVLGRGGGSYESMMPFNDEGLARAIAACPVPVVTGIGHEPDTFIADMVADVRASTPTWAATAACPDQHELAKQLSGQTNILQAAMRQNLSQAAAKLDRLASRPVLRDATQLFAQEALGLDQLAGRLERALPLGLERNRVKIDELARRLSRALPGVLERHQQACVQRGERLYRTLPQKLQTSEGEVRRQRERLRLCGRGLTQRFRQQIGLAAARLHNLSPLTILGRGYSIARNSEGVIVKSTTEVEVGASLNLTVSDGQIACKVAATTRVETGAISLP